MPISIDSIVTPGDIARILCEPLHRVSYCLNSRLHIRPIRRAGNVRIYSPEAVEQVRQELAAIESRRSRNRDASPVGSGEAANPVASV